MGQTTPRVAAAFAASGQTTPRVVPPSCQPISRKGRALLQQAEAHLECGDIESCARLCAKALGLGPNPFAHRLMGRCMLLVGQSSAAIEQYRLAVAADSADWETRIELCEALFQPSGGMGLPSDLAGAAEEHATGCLNAIQIAKQRTTSVARARAAEIRAHWMLSRLAKQAVDPVRAAGHMLAAGDLGRAWLNPPTSRLPRVDVSGGSRKVTLAGRRVKLVPLSKYPLLCRLRGLLSDEDCSHIISSATTRLEESGESSECG